MDALESLLPRITDPELRAGLWSNVRSALHNAAVDPVDVLEVAVRSLPIEDTEDSAGAARWPGSTAGSSRCSPTRRPRVAQLHAAALGKLDAAAPTSEEQLSAFRAAIGTGVRPGRPGRVAGRRPAARGRPARPRPALAGAGPARDARRRRPRRARPSARGRAHRRSPGCATRARAPPCPTPRRRPGPGRCFTGETNLPNYELEAVGLGLLARRAGGAHRAVRRALLRRPARHRQGAQRLGAGRGGRALLPADLDDPRDPRARPRRSSPTATSTCPSAAGWSTRRTPCSASSPSSRRTHADRMKARRPGPDRPDPGARARRRGRTAPRGPAGHRGAARDPAGLAGRAAAPGLGHDADAGPRLRARRGLAGPRGAGHRAAAHHRLLHRRRPDTGAGVQRRDGHPRRAADPRPRPPARRLRLVGLRGLRQGHDRRGAGRAGDRPVGRPGARPGRRTHPPGPAARGPARLRRHRRRARRGPGHGRG